MAERVAIIGIGATNFRATTPEVSYKELMFEAAVKAYADCGINPRKDVDTFVACAEDYLEGTSITNEYVPDQLGGVLKPVHTITGDGLQGLIAVYLQIKTGIFSVGVVEAFSKSSNIRTPDGIAMCAQDPIYQRPLRLNSHFIAGLEMNKFLNETRNTREQCALVVKKNRRAGLSNSFAGYGANLTIKDILNSKVISSPLLELDCARPADGSVVIVLASEKKARALSKRPVWIKGVGLAQDSPSLESRDWAVPAAVQKAGAMAYAMAGIKDPINEIDFCEIDDTFSYKELQHLEALKLTDGKNAGAMIESGMTERDGSFPVNPSGGSLGMGYLYTATGLARVFMAVLQLRKEAEGFQVKKANTGLVQSWRGLPTTSGAVVILGI